MKTETCLQVKYMLLFLNGNAMAMKIFESSNFSASDQIFFNRDFMYTVDSHLDYLKVAGNIVFRDIPDDSLDNYIGDYFAILTDMNIETKYHRIIMRVNGYMSPADYDGSPGRVMVPDKSIIDRILSVYNTGKGSLKLDIPSE